MGMNILIAGGAGFIGSHLVEVLLSRGDRVTVVDNYLTARPDNLDHLAGTTDLRIVRADIVSDPMPEDTYDVVYHLACPASPVDFERLALPIAAANSTGTMRLLDLCGRHDSLFVLASTSECYGDPEVHPQTESYRGKVHTTGPRAVYDEGKRFAEAVTSAAHRSHGVRVRIARIFNIFGPRMRTNDGRVIPTFITQALADEPLTVFGQGSQTRSFCYVDDLVEALVALIKCDYSEPVNLGNPNEVTIARLADEIIVATGSSSTLTHMPSPPDDPQRRCPDITLARKLLGWQPRISRQEGLERTIDYHRHCM